jgi:hypothetical protein
MIIDEGMKTLFAWFIMILLLFAAFHGLDTRAQLQPEPACSIQDKFSYYSTYNLIGVHEKTLKSHIVDVQFMNLGTENHAITIELLTREKLISINPFIGIANGFANSSQAGKILITAKSNGDYAELQIGLNNTESLFDPLNVAILPIGQSEHPLNPQGQLNFELVINNSEAIDSCDIAFSPTMYNERMIENLKLVNTDLKFENATYAGYGAYCFLQNLSKCDGQISFATSVNSLSGTVNVEVTAVDKNLYTLVYCYADGNIVNASGNTQAQYYPGSYSFHLQRDLTCYYGDEAQYDLNFTTPQTFQLRIDATDREEIGYLALSALPNDFSVSEMPFLGDEPCYTFTFNMSPNSRCLLGIDLKSKGWFLDPASMSLAEIPTEIEEQYLSPSGSADGQYFDTNNTFVQKWASQVTMNQTNPFIIADSIFQNITKTLNVTPNWQELEGQSYNESVTQILNARNGVCRHYARAYAALSICSGLPARTVIGTAFNYLDEIYKKNHEWVEVYLPGYGWVTMDPTWGQEFLLDDQHADVTYWNYMPNSLNVTVGNATTDAQAELDGKALMAYLLMSCEQLANKSQDKQQAEILIDQARLLVDKGAIHEALVNIAKAYILVSSSLPTQISIEGLVVLILVSSFIIALIILRENKSARRKRELNLKPMETSLERPGRELLYLHDSDWGSFRVGKPGLA